MKRSGPYVGVTGFMTVNEVIECGRAFTGAVAETNKPAASALKFMVGVLVSSKTLSGGTNKWPNRYPPVSRLPEILATGYEEHLLQTVHYNTDDETTIDEQIDQVAKLSGTFLHALQLNMRWVKPVKLQRIRRKYPDLRIILQIGAGALGDVAEPGEIFLGEALRSYEGVIDDFLVDPSGGKGEPLNVWQAFASLADRDIPTGMQPGIAGGFCAENVHTARGLMRRLGPVNLDAEGRLRTPHDQGDQLDTHEATRYSKEGVKVLAAVM